MVRILENVLERASSAQGRRTEGGDFLDKPSAGCGRARLKVHPVDAAPASNTIGFGRALYPGDRRWAAIKNYVLERDGHGQWQSGPQRSWAVISTFASGAHLYESWLQSAFRRGELDSR
ncbi:MAG: hypothetical protein U1G07_15625 [Verrucomicrobiota bacterium]